MYFWMLVLDLRWETSDHRFSSMRDKIRFKLPGGKVTISRPYYLENEQNQKRSWRLFKQKAERGYWVLSIRAIGMRWGCSIGRDLCLTEQDSWWVRKGGRGVSYGHLYFPYSHLVTPVIRTHFKPHSVYAQYTQPYSHPLLIITAALNAWHIIQNSILCG